MFGALYGAVGRVLPSGRKAGTAAFNAARKSSLPAGMRGSIAARGPAAIAARNAAYRQAGKKPARIGMAAGAIGASTAMRPNADQSRTSYRGPMQTGRGVGRYA